MVAYDKRRNPFTPEGIRDADCTGMRRSVQRIISLVDTTDPAWPGIAAVLREFDGAGIELDETTVAMAIKIGKARWGKGEADVQPALVTASDSIVYYVRRGALIKIGTTRHPQDRFTDLMPSEILAIEPGGYDTEAARHRQFAHLHTGYGKEHFRDAPELLGHIREVRAAYGEPDPSWVTIGAGKEHWRLPLATSIDLLTAREAEAQLGIKRSTTRSWKAKGRLSPAGTGDNHTDLFYREHLIRLRDSTRARQADCF